MKNKKKSIYVCQTCGLIFPKWTGRCHGCATWNSLVEESLDHKSVIAGKIKELKTESTKLKTLNTISVKGLERIKTSFGELNRVLGGGAVPGSLILVGGEPGVGKSTLLLQIIGGLSGKQSNSKERTKVLYTSGEESSSQIKSRAERLGVSGESILLLNETCWEKIEEVVSENKIKFLIIDSIQTITSRELDSAPGSISQVREVTHNLMNYCKSRDVTAFIVGHITKDGLIAGPKLLEHMVDTVIYFEGEQLGNYRILRAVKNRFGNTNEIGIFEMHKKGLKEILRPTQVFLQEGIKDSFGRSLSCIVEGSRTIFIEVQALVVKNQYGNGRRTTQGFDSNRLALIIAIMEKYLQIQLNFSDVYLNIVGGIKANGRESDLSVMCSLLSSHWSKALDPNTLFLGELGLTGEIRSPKNIEMRLKEMAQLNYKRLITSSKVAAEYKDKFPIELIGLRKAQDIANFI